MQYTCFPSYLHLYSDMLASAQLWHLLNLNNAIFNMQLSSIISPHNASECCLLAQFF